MIILREKLYSEAGKKKLEERAKKKANKRKWQIEQQAENLKNSAIIEHERHINDIRKLGNLRNSISEKKKSSIPAATKEDAKLGVARFRQQWYGPEDVLEEKAKIKADNLKDFKNSRSEALSDYKRKKEWEELQRNIKENFEIREAERKKAASDFDRKVEAWEAKKAKRQMRAEISREAPERLARIKKLERTKAIKKVAPYAIAGTLATGAAVAGVKALKKKNKDKE